MIKRIVNCVQLIYTKNEFLATFILIPITNIKGCFVICFSFLLLRANATKRKLVCHQFVINKNLRMVGWTLKTDVRPSYLTFHFLAHFDWFYWKNRMRFAFEPYMYGRIICSSYVQHYSSTIKLIYQFYSLYM